MGKGGDAVNPNTRALANEVALLLNQLNEPEFMVAVGWIRKERQRQQAKWGKQLHSNFIWLAILTEEVGELAQAILHDKFGGRAKGTAKTELLHVAAVAVQWLEAYVLEEHNETQD